MWGSTIRTRTSSEDIVCESGFSKLGVRFGTKLVVAGGCGLYTALVAVLTSSANGSHSKDR